MFDALGSRLQAVFGSFRAEVKLTPELVEKGLREIRIALLEADVNFKVAREFVSNVKEKVMDDEEILKSITAGQHVSINSINPRTLLA